ncbi:MAG: hydrolase, partial [Croceitalea sp.]|nr:hydrolase [Croceitalea sp.]
TSLTFSHSDIQLDTGNVTAFVSGLRLSYSFTPRMFLQSLIQRNNVSNITSVNARFGWLQNANTGLFVVLNIVKDDDALDAINNQIFTVKYTHRFDLMK